MAQSGIQGPHAISYDANPYTPIAILGSGASGICAAMQLIRNGVKHEDIVLFERLDDISGTWHANTYPGCACDVPAVFYSFSFEQNPAWTSFYPSNHEIHSYYRELGDKYGLYPRMSFHTEIVECAWDESRGIWKILCRRINKEKDNRPTFLDVQKAREEEKSNCSTWIHEAKVILPALGGLHQPRPFPSTIKGREVFKGPILHSAAWDNSVSLKDKNVVVVGNGCSACQIVPAIADEVKSVTQLFRNPHWITPAVQPSDPEKYKAYARKVFTAAPVLMYTVRFIIFIGAEAFFAAFRDNKKGEKVRRAQEKLNVEHCHKYAPAKYWDSLIPKYEFGCKRRIFDTNYYSALHKENVLLARDEIVSLKENYVVTKTGKEYPCDVLGMANGFETHEWGTPVRFYGSKESQSGSKSLALGDKQKAGLQLHEHWKSQGGSSAYMTSAIAGFPNMFLLFGPNGATGHSSVIMTVENTVNYVLQLVLPIYRGEVARAEIKQEAYQAWVDDMQNGLKQTVWKPEYCDSWYVNKETGWNGTVYPHTQINFWWRSRKAKLADWNLAYTREGLKRKMASGRRRAIFGLICVIFAALAMQRYLGGPSSTSNLVSKLQGVALNFIGRAKALMVRK